jgi:IS5 family transposase
MARKGSGREARLCYAGHTLVENRNGLIVEAELTQASGTAEREAALRLLGKQRARQGGRLSVGADKGYDTAGFVAGVRALGVTPHVARKKRGSALDGRTTRHRSYATSQRRRKLIEQGYGWMKVVGGLHKLRHRGTAKAAALFTFSCAAYNLVRLRTLLAEPALT